MGILRQSHTNERKLEKNMVNLYRKFYISVPLGKENWAKKPDIWSDSWISEDVKYS